MSNHSFYTVALHEPIHFPAVVYEFAKLGSVKTRAAILIHSEHAHISRGANQPFVEKVPISEVRRPDKGHTYFVDGMVSYLRAFTIGTSKTETSPLCQQEWRDEIFSKISLGRLLDRDSLYFHDSRIWYKDRSIPRPTVVASISEYVTTLNGERTVAVLGAHFYEREPNQLDTLLPIDGISLTDFLGTYRPIPGITAVLTQPPKTQVPPNTFNFTFRSASSFISENSKKLAINLQETLPQTEVPPK